MWKLVLAALAVAGGLFFYSTVQKSMGPRPEIVYEQLLGGEPGATDFDGFVRKGDAYVLQIRFRTGDDWIRGLTTAGFREIDCSLIQHQIEFSWSKVAAWPLWRPETLEDTICYRRFGENAWSPDARDLILAEEAGGWVYFDSEGKEHDRAATDEYE